MLPLHPQLGRQIITGLLSGAFFIACLIQPATAQTDYAKLTVVVVKEATGSPVSNVTVTLLRGQKESRTCTTKDDGSCVFAALVPLTYEIRVRSNNKADDNNNKTVSPS